MASAPFKIKQDIKGVSLCPKNRALYEVGIPSLFWKRLLPAQELEQIDKILELPSPIHILICSTPTEDAAMLHAFSYLWALRSRFNGCAIPLDKLPNWNDSEFDGDLLTIYPLSPKSINWQAQSIRTMWFKYSIILSFCGTPSEFQDMLKLNAMVINIRGTY